MPIWIRLTKLPMEWMDSVLLWKICGMLGTMCKVDPIRRLKREDDTEKPPFGPWMMVSYGKQRNRNNGNRFRNDGSFVGKGTGGGKQSGMRTAGKTVGYLQISDMEKPTRILIQML
ncbi:hypothetical protein LWI28_004938 [Acer negundo]|uniref:DUF4283 domain-containing protein n=1 Tax=Acer negundo TaxID=4023 RepID=A0AAD5IC35_ACENE|nr:hypothetical protein LWI28_004938 [Acer negundo]